MMWERRKNNTGLVAIKGPFRMFIEREASQWWWRVIYRDDLIGSSGIAKTITQAKKAAEFEIARWTKLLGLSS
jgi:hypothetical protein